MDFKSLISKLDSMEAPPKTPQAPRLPEKIQLDEDAELRVLAGTSTILAEAAIMEKKLTKAEKAKKEEVVKSMKDDKAGFKKRYGKRGEEVMHATATKIAKKKDESVESNDESLSEAGLDMNLIKAASEKGMGARKSDSESDRNIQKPYGYRGDDGSDEAPMRSTATSTSDAIRDKAEYILASKVRTADDIDRHIVPLIFKNNRDIDDSDFEEVAEKLISMAEMEDLADPSSKFYTAVGDAVVEPYKFLGKKKSRAESIDRDQFRSKFLSLVEAKKREAEEKKIKGKKKPDADNDGVPDWADEKPGEDDNADKKATKGMTAKQKKLPPGLQKAIAAKKDDKTEGIIGGAAKLVGRGIGGVSKAVGALTGVPGGIKRAFSKGKQKSQDVISGDDRKESREINKHKNIVKESIEPKMTFRDMMRLVVESGGQQQIDPLDKALFDWATRVATNKLGEGMQAEIYAGMIYERMGGRFEMYDVLSESKKIDESPEDDPFEKSYRSWKSPNPWAAAQDARERSARAELLFSKEEKQVIDTLFDEMRSVYPNSLRHYKNYREGRGKKPGKEFSTLSVKGAHRSDRLSLEAEEFDRKIKELGGKKKVDPIAKTIVWTLPRFQT